MSKILQGQTTLSKEHEAVAEISRQLNGKRAGAVILFVSSQYDLTKVEMSLGQFFQCPVYGCTTAGEIGKNGYSKGGITGFSLDRKTALIKPILIENMSALSDSDFTAECAKAKKVLEKTYQNRGKQNQFGILLTDGLSMIEERLVTELRRGLTSGPLLGGSAGDDLNFKNTYVIHNGRFVKDAALVLSFLTPMSVFTFRTQNFVPSEEKLVVTSSDPEKRIVYTINDKPAADEFARLAGLGKEERNALTFSKFPVMVSVGGDHFVRSIRTVGDDQSLSFYCAIDEGTVMRLARRTDFVENLKEALESIHRCVVSPEIIICFECILRRLDVVAADLSQTVGQLYSDSRAVGFHTYGEQYNSVHMNQTLAGIALGTIE